MGVFFQNELGGKNMDDFMELDYLNILSEILNSKNPSHNLDLVLSKAAEIMKAEAATIVLWTANLGVFYSTVNIPPDIPLKGQIITPESGGLDGRIFKNPEKQWIQLTNYSKNVDALPNLKPAEFFLALGGKVEIPQSHLFATICFYFKQRTEKFDEKELVRFPILLTQLGIAIYNAHLFQEYQNLSGLNEETTNFLQLLVNSSPDVIINLDPNGKIKLWNNVAEDLLNYSAHEISDEFIPIKKGKNQEKFINLLSEARRGKIIQNEELVFIPKSLQTAVKPAEPKKELVLEISLVPIKNQREELQSLLLTGKDITKTKALITKLEKSSLELSQKNAALSIKEHQLNKTQQELITAEKLASIGKIISKLNHQINNPLMSLFSLLSISLDDLQDMERFCKDNDNINEKMKKLQIDLKSQLNDAIIQGNRIKNVLKKVRYFSDIATEKHFRDNTNLVEVINQSLINFKNWNFKKPISINFHPELKTALIYGNFKQLQFTFSALLENAIHAVEYDSQPGNSGRIDIYLRPIELNKRRYVRIEIMDNGIGLTLEEREHLYDPFYSNWPEISATDKDQTDLHIGLSLAIVKLITINHNAYINAYSKETGIMDFNQEITKGTKFVIDFPSI